MRTFIWIMGLWLLGIAPGYALDLQASETLKYKVYWGYVPVGRAQLAYTPAANGNYTLEANVKDSSALIELQDSWQSLGTHTKARPFVPALYSVKQAENSYRADKTMTFDAKEGKALYLNRIDPSDLAEPVVYGEARDALATVYAWRMGGLAEVQKAAQISIVTIKKIVTLQRDAGVRVSLTIDGQKRTVWKVAMRTVKDGKTAKDSWITYLSDDANLTPLQIVASTKFGTFTATLDN